MQYVRSSGESGDLVADGSRLWQGFAKSLASFHTIFAVNSSRQPTMSRSLVAPSRQPCSLISLSCLVRHSWGARRGLQTPTHAAVASRQFLRLDPHSLGTCSLQYSYNLSSSKYSNRRPPRYKDPVHAGPAMVRITVQRYPLAQHSHSTRYHDPSKSSSSSYNGSYSWTNGASAIFRFTGSAHSLNCI